MDFPTNSNVSIDTSNTSNTNPDFGGNDIATHNNAGQTFGGENVHGKKGGFNLHGGKGGYDLFGKKGEMSLEEEAVRAVNDIVDYQETTSEHNEEMELEADFIAEDILKTYQVDKGGVEIDSSTDKG